MTGRRVLAAAGIGIDLAAPPVQFASRAAFLVMWYAGLLLLAGFVVLDIRAGRRPT